MGYVDLIDFDKKIGGLLTEKSHFKKWYKKVYLGIMDFMLVNSHVAWNMSVKLKGFFRTTLNNATWRMYIAKHILNWKDPSKEIESPILLPSTIDNQPPKDNIKIGTNTHLVFSVWLRNMYSETSWNSNY